MSQADVDHYGDGAWYDAEYVHIGGDISHYTKVATSTAGPILELACGTGRLTFPMALAGATVHGIDLAQPMIDRALEKRTKLPAEVQARLQFVAADMRTFRAGRTYSAVVLGFNTLMHMTEDPDLEAALATARTHLAPGGLFHLDVHTPFFEYLMRDPDGRYDPQEMISPAGQRYIVTENNRYDHRTQINTVHFYYQPVDRERRHVGDELRTTLRLRVIFPRELDRWLAKAGFEIVEDWDDLEKCRPFTGRGGRRVVTAKAV
jgi:SAM-dependent methyltransferase